MSDTENQATDKPALSGSDEFKAAIAAAVRDALAAERAANPPQQPVMPDFLEAMRLLAKEMVNATKESINSEKRQRGEAVPLTADEEHARNDARQQMGGLIMDARKLPLSEAPLYRVMAPMWLNENLIMPYQRVAKEADPQPVRIRFTGEPNLQMLPLNDAAKGIYSFYLRYLGGTGAINEVINQFGISLTKRPDQWISERGRLTTVAPNAGDRSMTHIEADPLDLSNFERPATGADDAMAIMTADDPRQKEMNVLGTVHNKAQRGNFTDKVSLQNVT